MLCKHKLLEISDEGVVEEIFPGQTYWDKNLKLNSNALNLLEILANISDYWTVNAVIVNAWFNECVI